MITKTYAYLLVLTIGFSSAGKIQAQAQKPLPQLGKNSLKEVIAAMTLDEKVKLVVGTGMRMPGAPPPGGPVVGQTQVKVPGAAGNTYAIPRLGIPSIVVADGPAGVRIQPYRNNDSSRSYFATAFPVSTLLASSWDTALVRKVGLAFGQEVHEYGVDILLAPAQNIHRNPLGGRNFEYYSEDPLLSGLISAAMVKGVQSNGVGTSMKHFAANNQETNRNTVNTILSERALREIYLRNFEITVKLAKPWTVMSSYNFINGVYTSQDPSLLTTILRDEWNYKGFVMTDWFGGTNPVEQMIAGNDLIMPGTPQQADRILSAIQHDSLKTEVLDRNIERILKVILQSPSFKKYAYSDKPDLKKDAEVARTAAEESIVLLKNESNTLPLKDGIKLALYGNTSYDPIAGGTGSGDVNKAYNVSLAQGMSNAGFTQNGLLRSAYSQYIAAAKASRPKPRSFFERQKPITEMWIDPAELASQAAMADMAIITIGRNAGEGADRKLENDYQLSDTERVVFSNIASAFHAKNKKVIFVLNIGGVIDVAGWRDLADAILLAWQPGMEGGNAIASVLTGKVNPSGKLATSFPLAYADVPSAKNFPGKEFPEKAYTGNFGRKMVPAEVTYEEGVYVGYRYYNTFKVATAYPFGYGLSYTTFSYDNMLLTGPASNGRINVRVTVKNTGPVAGREVVQLYVSAPGVMMDKPAMELKGFAKTGLLQPGQSQSLSFDIYPSDLASFLTPASAWVAEKGKYIVKIGASSTDIRKTAGFELAKDITVEKVHKVMTPKTDIKEYQPK